MLYTPLVTSGWFPAAPPASSDSVSRLSAALVHPSSRCRPRPPAGMIARRRELFVRLLRWLVTLAGSLLRCWSQGPNFDAMGVSTNILARLRMRVLEFGGSSLATPDRIRDAGQIVLNTVKAHVRSLSSPHSRESPMSSSTAHASRKNGIPSTNRHMTGSQHAIVPRSRVSWTVRDPPNPHPRRPTTRRAARRAARRPPARSLPPATLDVAASFGSASRR